MNVKPSDIDTSGHFWSTFGDYEIESVARNLVIISKKNGNDWNPFTFEQYRRLCNHEAGPWDKQLMEQMVRRELLSKEGEIYSFNEAFVGRLGLYIKKEMTKGSK